MGLFVWLPCFLPDLWSLNCPEKCIVCNFVLTSTRNLSLLKKFTYMHLKFLITLFQKIIWFTGVWAIVHEIFISNWNIKKILSLNATKSFDFKQNLSNISETGSHSITNNTIFWKCVTRTFRCMYVNCFSRFRFLAEASTKLQNMETRQTEHGK